MGGLRRTVYLSAVLILSSLGLVFSRPSSWNRDGDPFHPTSHGTHIEIRNDLAGIKRQNGDFELRIMPLGASIMSGVGADGNGGLRRYVRGALREDGWEVNMVGTKKSGSMVDNDHEAVPGDVIDQVRARFNNAKGFKPNVILINAGTNDANQGVDVSNVGQRMERLLDDIWNAPDMNSTCVFLSTLLPTGNANGRVNRIPINDQYRSLVQKRAEEGDCIFLAEMATTQEPLEQNEPFKYPDEFVDEAHPNRDGHKKMAAIFHQSINVAVRADRIKAPGGDIENAPSGGCDKHAGTSQGVGGLTQRGSGADDGIYYHDSVEMPTPLEVTSEWDMDQWRFARLFSQGYDDLLASLKEADGDNVDRLVVWVNSADGKGDFKQAVSELQTNIQCPFSGVNFLDMNADGLDDLVCLFSDGRIEIAVNEGNGDREAGSPPTFKYVGEERPAGEVDSDRVILGDIDGDGRGDYGVLRENGEIEFWRNDGRVADLPRTWQYLGVRFPTASMVDQKGYWMEDINGDGRDDIMFVDPAGETTTWTNARSCQKGVEGDGLHVAWRQGFKKGESTGPTHPSIPSGITDDEKDIRDRIYFARIYGETPVIGNLAKQDYVFMEHQERDDGNHQFIMHAWKNTGNGGTKLLADGNRYCNVLGHEGGNVDYVWIWDGGDMELWASREKQELAEDDPDGWWEYRGYMWTPPREMSRRDLHLADWDGDGRCDIIYTDPETGAVEVWINEENGSLPRFRAIDNPAPQLECEYRNGLALRDIAVRFADLTGNGRADYLCMAPDARTTGFIQNNDGNFDDVGQIKISDGYDRADFQWTDVSGDGKADLLRVEKFSGDAYVWYNEKQGLPGEFLGSAFLWRRQAPPDKAYAGLAAGTCEYHVDMDGNGRADIQYLLGALTNEARTLLSPDCGLVDTEPGDDSFEPLPDPPNPDPED